MRNGLGVPDAALGVLALAWALALEGCPAPASSSAPSGPRFVIDDSAGLEGLRLVRVVPDRLPVEGGPALLEFLGVVPDAGFSLSVGAEPFAILGVNQQSPMSLQFPPHLAGSVEVAISSIDSSVHLGALEDAVTYEFVHPGQLTLSIGSDPTSLENLELPLREERAGPCARHARAELKNPGGAPLEALSVEMLGAGFSLRANDCSANLLWWSSCFVEICFNGVTPGINAGTLRVTSLTVSRDAPVQVTVIPAVEGIDPRFVPGQSGPLSFRRLAPWDDGAIFVDDRAVAVTAEGQRVELADGGVTDVLAEPDGGLLVLLNDTTSGTDTVLALDARGSPRPRFGGSSTLTLRPSSGQRLWVQRDGRPLLLEGTGVQAFDQGTGQPDPSYGLGVPEPRFAAFPDGALQASDERLFFRFWVVGGQLLIELDAQGQTTRTLELPYQSAFAPAPSGALLFSRGPLLFSLEGTVEQPADLHGAEFQGYIRALAFDSRGRLLVADERTVRRFDTGGLAERTWGDLPMLNELVCPAHGGCYAIGDLVWRLTDD